MCRGQPDYGALLSSAQMQDLPGAPLPSTGGGPSFDSPNLPLDWQGTNQGLYDPLRSFILPTTASLECLDWLHLQRFEGGACCEGLPAAEGHSLTDSALPTASSVSRYPAPALQRAAAARPAPADARHWAGPAAAQQRAPAEPPSAPAQSPLAEWAAVPAWQAEAQLRQQAHAPLQLPPLSCQLRQQASPPMGSAASSASTVAPPTPGPRAQPCAAAPNPFAPPAELSPFLLRLLRRREELLQLDSHPSTSAPASWLSDGESARTASAPASVPAAGTASGTAAVQGCGLKRAAPGLAEQEGEERRKRTRDALQFVPGEGLAPIEWA